MFVVGSLRERIPNDMSANTNLPRGQHAIDELELPRFGLVKFAKRFPRETEKIGIDIGGDLTESTRLTTEISQLERVDQISDFHCVTTWTKRNVRWSGFRFSDFYKRMIQSNVQTASNTIFVIFRGQDGYQVGMLLKDLLAADVLLADRLEGQALPVANGAPIRLVAPAHYGYKNVKHISKIEFWQIPRAYRPAALKFIDHPRARVEYEERGIIFPGWILRRLYRPLIKSTMRKFQIALTDHIAESKKEM